MPESAADRPLKRAARKRCSVPRRIRRAAAVRERPGQRLLNQPAGRKAPAASPSKAATAAYRLRVAGPLPAGIRRVIREQCEYAAAQLRGAPDGNRDEAVHEARKSIKKIRAALRLLSGAGVAEAVRAENFRLRNLSRRLSGLRDARAMLDVVDEIAAKLSGEVEDRTLASIRNGVLAEKRETESEAAVGNLLRAAASALERTPARLAGWKIGGRGFGVIAGGLERTFRKCRKALSRARKDPSEANFHEWRKRVKDHWYHVRLLAGLDRAFMSPREKDLAELAACLGDEHNLAVLRARIASNPRLYGRVQQLAAFFRFLDGRQGQLRKTALAAGARLFRPKPAKLLRRLERFWRDQRRRKSLPAPSQDRFAAALPAPAGASKPKRAGRMP